MKTQTQVWNEIRYDEYEQHWIGEIWVRTMNNFYIFDTVLDQDEEMFHYWLNHYTLEARNCLNNTQDIDEASACYLGA